jgi:hypothetical protein
VHTDSSLNLLLPILARPIVQQIVNASILGFDTLLISNAEETSFNVTIKGSITQAGPFDAVISFPAGLTVAWEGTALGHIAMPNVTIGTTYLWARHAILSETHFLSVVGDSGANLDLTATFAVADVATLGEFSKILLTSEYFTWAIYGEDLTVSALGAYS